MKFKFSTLTLILFLSCTSKPNYEDISKLNGFWEIEKAETPYGDKSYTMNQMVDYFEIQDSTGFRKKMQPSLLGNYQSSLNRDYFIVEDYPDSLVIIYKNAYDTWYEKVLSISEDEFVVQNEQNFIYTYKKHNSKLIISDEE